MEVEEKDIDGKEEKIKVISWVQKKIKKRRTKWWKEDEKNRKLFVTFHFILKKIKIK